VTITDAIDVEDGKLDEISARITELLGCLRPENEYTLEVDRVGFWRGSSNEAVLIMKPNRNVELLHDVLVTDLHSRGKGSDYTRKYEAAPDSFEPSSATDIQRVKTFFSPYIFDNFVPHFTCLGAFPGTQEERTAIEAELKEALASAGKLTMDTLALVVQKDGEDYFSIFKEFSLHGDL
jgi:2'-5' RNA ligase